MKMTRRKLAAALAAPPLAWAVDPQAQPQPSDPLAAARDRIRANAEALAQKPVPMSVEPAFQFKA